MQRTRSSIEAVAGIGCNCWCYCALLVKTFSLVLALVKKPFALNGLSCLNECYPEKLLAMHPALRVPPGGNQVDGLPPAAIKKIVASLLAYEFSFLFDQMIELTCLENGLLGFSILLSISI